MGNIRKIETITRLTAIDNGGDTNASYAISAEAETQRGELRNINNGKVLTAPGGQELATFTRYGSAQFNVTFWQGAEDRAAVLAAIEGFVSDVAGTGWEEEAVPVPEPGELVAPEPQEGEEAGA